MPTVRMLFPNYILVIQRKRNILFLQSRFPPFPMEQTNICFYTPLADIFLFRHPSSSSFLNTFVYNHDNKHLRHDSGNYQNKLISSMVMQ